MSLARFFVNRGQTFLGTDLCSPGISAQVTAQGSSVNPGHLGPGPALGTGRLPSTLTSCPLDPLPASWASLIAGCLVVFFLSF